MLIGLHKRPSSDRQSLARSRLIVTDRPDLTDIALELRLGDAWGLEVQLKDVFSEEEMLRPDFARAAP
jgi:hypothetical protein